MRLYNELVAAWGDLFSLPLTVVLMILGALAIGLLWYFWPSWWHGLLGMRLRRSREGKSGKKKSAIREVTDAEIEEVVESEEELPNVDAAVFAALADRLAAQGRYAEAVRERLRAMVRELVDRGVITHHPGWTVTELASAAGSAAAPVAPPIDAASHLFSDIWYAKKPAQSEDDNRMRALASQLHDAMAGSSR
ncbi:hypothetical protein Rhe02_51290 [Rhizocola hellebori]|uniref:Protein-glutamine gamma-glutamyltransferase-like C-terminal domain-containing protein n=1 Tax=Rhizocola hellebori TaxID=1392758 RepID=A0A8J3VI77_9ACTN|nr:DUF4129 domain-containing protein [Rhizocola hellebori]GIH07062.1 hypothetical protein Rhe02_51290 [Rhizocola hellebori]